MLTDTVAVFSKLTYANVVATLALFIALGGTTFAATQLHGSQIKRGTVTGKQIRAGSVPGGDLRRNSVTGRQVNEAKLGVVPRARKATSADQAARSDQAAKAERAIAADTAALAARAVSADTATAATDAAALGGLSPSAYLDRCAPGTRAYAGVCIEVSARTSATWPTAARICGDAGGRLPELGELEGFRRQPGITLDGSEHTSTYIDVNGIDAGGEFTVGLNDNGGRSPGFIYGVSNANYRCVMPLSNR